MANPGLGEAERADLVGGLMAARRAVRGAKKTADCEAEAAKPAMVSVSRIQTIGDDKGSCYLMIVRANSSTV
jgi:hypothetical protein